MKLRTLLCFALVICVVSSSETPLLLAPAAEKPATPASSEMVLSLSGDPRTLDPRMAGDVVSMTQCGMAYETLYEYDYFTPGRVIPCLAQDMPKVSAGGKQLEITLKQGVRFQDDVCFPDSKGRVVTAGDFVFSVLSLAAQPDPVGWWALEEKIEGLDEWRERAVEKPDLPMSVWGDVKGLKAKDERTIEIILTDPNPRFLHTLCMLYLAVIPKEAIERYGDEFERHPVGTGPFKLEAWEAGQGIVWTKNPNYREALFPIAPAGHTDKRRYEQLEGRRLPLLSKVTYRILAEEMSEWQDFLAGQIDVCSIPIDKYDEVFTKDGRLGPLLMGDGKFVNLHTPDRPVIEYISFNMTHKSIGTPAGEKGAALRKAIGLAFDRQKYIDEHLKGRGTVATGLIPKGIVGFDEKQPYPWSVYSEEKARAVLTKAGFKVEKTGSGWKTTDPDTGAQPEVTILTRGTTAASKNMAAFIDDIGPKIGVKVAGECMDFAKYLRMQEEGKGHAYDSGWILDYPDAENILQLLWGENAKEFGINSSRYTSKAYDELYIRMLPLDQTIESQCAKKMEIIQSMMKVLADDCPIIPLYFDRSKSLSHEWVYPYESCDFSFATAKYRFVDEDIRLKKSILWK